MKDVLSWEDQQLIERMAPERIALPRGWRMRIHYSETSPPRGRAKIQDLYGLTQSPTVPAGRAKVLLEILAPSMQPVQATEDLANFWKELYPTLRKELARKYPKHEWRIGAIRLKRKRQRPPCVEGRALTLPLQTILSALFDLRPRVLQRDGAVEHERAGL